jgi:NAD(P)H-dependent FMN reductase
LLVFVSYGGHAAGYRAVEQLRLVAVELQMVPVREQVAIQPPWTAFDAQGELSRSGAEEAVAPSMGRRALEIHQTEKPGCSLAHSRGAGSLLASAPISNGPSSWRRSVWART